MVDLESFLVRNIFCHIRYSKATSKIEKSSSLNDPLYNNRLDPISIVENSQLHDSLYLQKEYF